MTLSMFGALGAAPAVADASVQIAGGSLEPAFDEGIVDYTVRCDLPVVMHVEASGGTEVDMDGDGFRSGSFDVPAPLSEDEGFEWVVRTDGVSTTYHAR